MPRPRINHWDRRFFTLAADVAQWSKDPSTRVGAVIANDLHQVLGLGFNGFPREMDDSPHLYADRPTKYARVLHAEVNAILNAIASVRGETIYVTMYPCHECAKVIIQSGIERLVTAPPTTDRWDESHKNSARFFQEAGIIVDEIDIDLSLREKYPMTFKDG